MDIYLTASQFGKYPGLATSTSVNNCYIFFLLYFVGLFSSEVEAEKITICPRHRDVYGTRWKCNKRRCVIPSVIRGHTGIPPPKGDRGVTFLQAESIFCVLGVLVPIGVRKYH